MTCCTNYSFISSNSQSKNNPNHQGDKKENILAIRVLLEYMLGMLCIRGPSPSWMRGFSQMKHYGGFRTTPKTLFLYVMFLYHRMKNISLFECIP